MALCHVISPHTLFLLCKKRVLEHLPHGVFGLLASGTQTHPHPSPNILHLIYQHVYKLLHNSTGRTAKSNSPKIGNTELRLVSHMLFQFKYNQCLSWCTWKELGYALNSDVVCGRLPTFTAETERGTMREIAGRGRILSLLKKKCHLDMSLSECVPGDPFRYQTMS